MPAPKLTSRSWLTLTFLLACCLRAVHRYLYRSLYFDTEAQLAAAARWLKTYEFAICNLHNGDFSLRSLHIFMPGYAASVWPGFALSGDVLLAAYLVDLLALLLLGLGLRQLLGLAFEGRPSKLLLLFWLFWGLSPAPVQYMGSAELLSLAGFLWGSVVLLRAWRQASPAPLHLAAAVSLLGLAGLVRSQYLFAPVLPLAAWLLLWAARLRKPSAVEGFGLLASGLAWTAVLARLHSGAESFLKNPDPGWRPENLLHLDPFPLKAFVYYGVPHELMLKQLHPGLPALLLAAAWMLSLLFCALLLAALRQMARRSPLWQGAAAWLLAVAGWNLGSVAWLSLTWPADDWNAAGFWTFVMETRYYAPLQFLMLWLGVSAAQLCGMAGRWLRLWWAAACGLALLAAVLLALNAALPQARRGVFQEFRWPEVLAAVQAAGGWEGKAVVFCDPEGHALAGTAGACLARWEEAPAQWQQDSLRIWFVWQPAGAAPPGGRVWRPVHQDKKRILYRSEPAESAFSRP